MEKKVISGILLIMNACFLIAIVVLISRLVARGPEPEEPAVDEAAAETVSADAPSVSEDVAQEEPEYERLLIALPNVTNSVNVRSGPGTDYERIGSAYADCEYEVIEIISNGWTKLYYDDQVGYISSEYLSYEFKMVYGEDSYTYETVTEEELQEYMTD